MTITLLQGDCREVLPTLPAESVQCVVTSPPYYGLRDYGTASWAGGDPECQHTGVARRCDKPGRNDKQSTSRGTSSDKPSNTCLNCGARRVDEQIGLERSPQEYVDQLVAVFREVRRVLRKDGTLWLNLGDSFAGSWGAQGRGGAPSDKSTLQGNGHVGGGPKIKSLSSAQIAQHPKKQSGTGTIRDAGLKPKDLIGIPWRVAFALQADGWWLRSDIIWHKPNPMPESVRDRPTSAHEHVFLLSKSERYFYDADMIREPAVGTELGDIDGGPQRLSDGSNANPGRNYRQPNSPQSIASPHGQGFTRRAKGNAKTFRGGVYTGGKAFDNSASMRRDSTGNAPNETFSRNARNVWTIATRPFPEAHFATFPPELAERCIRAGSREGDTVLDPFGGAGTTGLAADRLGRHATLIELSADYIAIARRRLQADAPLLTEIA